MKRLFRTDPIGDHCFYNYSGFGALILMSVVVAVFSAIAAVMVHPLLFICSVGCIVSAAVMCYFALAKMNGEVRITVDGLKIQKGNKQIASVSWSQIQEIGYQSWTTEKRKRVGVAYVALEPLTNEQRIINTNGSMNYPNKRKQEFDWIYLCSGSEDTVKRATMLMRKWKQEYSGTW